MLVAPILDHLRNGISWPRSCVMDPIVSNLFPHVKQGAPQRRLEIRCLCDLCVLAFYARRASEEVANPIIICIVWGLLSVKLLYTYRAFWVQ